MWPALLLQGLLFLSCQSSTNLASTVPAAQVAQTPLPAPRLSTITLPISVPTSVLEQALNQQLTGVLYQDNDLTDDDLAVKVTKTGAIKLKAEFSKLIIEIPLKVWAKGRWQWNACELCKSLQKTEETEFDLVVRTESRLQVLPNYQLKSTTTGDFVWGAQKPSLSLGPLKINLAPFIEPELKAQLNPMLQRLDKELQQKVNLQTYLTDAWRQLQQPYLLHEGYKTWLTLVPQGVRLTPLELQNNQLSLQVGIDALLSVVTGQKPTATPPLPLPAFSPTRTLPQEAQIQINSDVSFAYLTAMLQQELNQKTFTFEDGKQQLTIHDVALTGAGSQFLLALDASGHAKTGLFTKKFQGKIYLKGTPYYDAPTQSLKVRDLAYDVQTQDQLVNAANWLLGNKFKAQLQQQMVFSVKDQLTATRQALQSGLSQTRLHEQVVLRGSHFTFDADTLFLTPTGVRALFVASGKLAVVVE